ncbi:hypothetical protein ACWCQN_01415 [Streptomyces sp. NPDC001984]|uniref:hypothetical protein n=1 Tax=Streptomyces sp. NPDC002619 TaxID=3364655 RepID=UPI0036B821B8
MAARPTERPSQFGDALVSCSGSMEIVDIPKLGRQLTFDLDATATTRRGTERAGAGIDTIAPF